MLSVAATRPPEKSGVYYGPLLRSPIVLLGCAPLRSFSGFAFCNNHTHKSLLYDGMQHACFSLYGGGVVGGTQPLVGYQLAGVAAVQSARSNPYRYRSWYIKPWGPTW